METYLVFIVLASLIFFIVANIIVFKMKDIQPFSDITPYVTYSGMSYLMSTILMIAFMGDVFIRKHYFFASYSFLAALLLLGCLILLTVIYQTEHLKGSFKRLTANLDVFNWILLWILICLLILSIFADIIS